MRWPWQKSPEIEQKDFRLTDPEALSLFGGWPGTASGVIVSENVAMLSTVARASIRTISETLAVLPCHLYRRDVDGNKERATDHPAERIVSGFSAPWLPSADFRRDLTFRALIDGSGYAIVTRVAGEVRELIPVTSGAIIRDADQSTGEPRYRVRLTSGQDMPMDWRDVLEIRPLAGRSPTRDASEAIGIAAQIETHVGKLFANSARPSGLLKFPGKLLGDSATRMRESWEKTFAGSGNSGRTAVIEEGGDFIALTMTSTDAQLLELRKFQVLEIARAYGIPPVLIGDMDRAVWRTPEQLQTQFLQFCILPWSIVWEGALSRTLLTEEERRDGYFFEFVLDELVRADLAARAEAYSKLIAARVLNPNEARAMENRAGYAGGDEFQNFNITPGAPDAADTSEGSDDE